MSIMTNMSANAQWRTRPADERFTSLTALQTKTQFTMDHSRSVISKIKF